MGEYIHTASQPLVSNNKEQQEYQGRKKERGVICQKAKCLLRETPAKIKKKKKDETKKNYWECIVAYRIMCLFNYF